MADRKVLYVTVGGLVLRHGFQDFTLDPDYNAGIHTIISSDFVFDPDIDEFDWNWDGVSTFTQGAAVVPVPEEPVLPSDHINDLELSYTTAATVTVGTGTCKDSTNTATIELTSSEVADITASGAGGLDTGSEAADTMYFVHVIGDSTGTNASDVLLSLSATSPTLPGTHDIFRRVGAVRNDASSDFLEFVSNGTDSTREITYTAGRVGELRVLSLGAGTSFTDIDLSDHIPSTSDQCKLLVEQTKKGKNTLIRPNGDTDSDGKLVVYGIDIEQADMHCPGQIIEYANDSSTGRTTIDILGYTDYL